MDCVTRLLSRAWLAGLTVELHGADLKIRGPRKAAPIVEMLRLQKAKIVAFLQEQACGPLHVRPERWTRTCGKAHCPRCGRYMGDVVMAESNHLE
jgi:hypothetical protein